MVSRSATLLLKSTTFALVHLGWLLLSLHSLMAQDLPESLSDRLYQAHDRFREPSLTQRRFKQKDISPLIQKRKQHPLYEVTEVGKSFENRPITMLKVGTGATKVLLWSQMHGDEPTATMALFDIFTFLEGKDDGFDALRALILEKTTLYAVPMLNPDGAERYQRHTAQGIDMNRDAARLQTPEGQLLRALQDSLKPDVGFNLHDQSPRYSAGRSPKVATISFLATAYDYERSLNAVRERSMQLIVFMNNVLQKYIPGHVARYSDEHEPRGFGDNIQKWGTTLVLVESGGYPNDPEKQYIRKLNFVSILMALHSLATDAPAQEAIAEYTKIPENGRYLYDLVVRNAQVKGGGKRYLADLGINRNEVNYAQATKFFYYSKIEEFGDLSTHFGSQELDATGLTLERGKVYPSAIGSLTDLAKLNPQTLLREGYTYVRLAGTTRASGLYFTVHPFHVLRNASAPTHTPSLGDTATFLLKEGNTVRYAIINGFVYDLTVPIERQGNGLVE